MLLNHSSEVLQRLSSLYAQLCRHPLRDRGNTLTVSRITGRPFAGG
jgi:hypothetical protein